MLAVDPGSKTSSYVVVRCDGASVTYLTGYTEESTPLGVGNMLCDAFDCSGPGEDVTIAVEVAEGHAYQPFRVPHLLGTAEAVGIITAMAHERGVGVLRMTAGEVRKALVGKAHGGGKQKVNMDQLIKSAVEAGVIDWPKRSNVHVRDAAALAIVAARKLAERKVA